MRVLSFLSGLMLALVALPNSTLAENLALVFGDRGQIASFMEQGGATAEDFADPLRQAGFRVIEPTNRSAADMRSAAQMVEAAIEAGPVESLVIVVMGPLASNDHDSWVMSDEAQGASGVTIGASGVSLNALSYLASATDGRAVILIAPGKDTIGLGTGLAAGLGGYERTDGVTYAIGPSPALATLLRDDLLNPDKTFAQVSRSAASDVELSGFLSSRVGLIGEAAPVLANPQAVEQGFWSAVQAIDTPEAYDVYLGAYAQGQHRGEAQERIKWLRDEPERQARDGELALKLTREARREIQRNLSLLGFDPRGIDGMFGAGSRAAITAWQRDNAFEETGFVTGNQLLRLREQAKTRAAELEEEARERRVQQERLDRAYWRDTGRNGDEAGLRAYLKRYPDGQFADIANARLGEIEEARRAETAREEREAWDGARDANTVAAYRQFLQTYPDSGFADAARDQLLTLEEDNNNAAAIDRARDEERKFAGVGVARMLIEQRLARLGTKPGEVDGKFTEETRQAIRRFQRNRQLPVTGYVSKATMVQLMGGR